MRAKSKASHRRRRQPMPYHQASKSFLKCRNQQIWTLSASLLRNRLRKPIRLPRLLKNSKTILHKMCKWRRPLYLMALSASSMWVLDTPVSFNPSSTTVKTYSARSPKASTSHTSRSAKLDWRSSFGHPCSRYCKHPCTTGVSSIRSS